WTCAPAAMSALARPITSSYLRIGAPAAIGTTASLWPKRIASVVVTATSPPSATTAPASRSVTATATLSAPSSTRASGRFRSASPIAVVRGLDLRVAQHPPAPVLAAHPRLLVAGVVGVHGLAVRAVDVDLAEGQVVDRAHHRRVVGAEHVGRQPVAAVVGVG